MATIYTVYDEFGLVGRCDSRCHNAKGTKCRCVCGGVFHGVGDRIAIEDAGHLADDELMENARKIYTGKVLRIYRRTRQIELFER